jgi:hypothetical protein
MDSSRELLRHTVATVAYRGARALRGAPDAFASFKAGKTTRTPAEMVAHMGDLYDWALSIAAGQVVWHNSAPLSWDEETARFFRALAAFDAFLASDAPLAAPVEKILQGPVADSLTHVGQLALLRGLAGSSVRGESYFKAGIVIGRVGPDQETPETEF